MTPRLILIVLTLATFAPLFTADFVRFDDAYTLHQNPRLNPPTWANVGRYWREWRTGEEGLYIPLTYTVWSALAKVARIEPAEAGGITLNPWIFHAANVLVHLISTLLVFGILMELLREPVAAGIGAAIFAVHPVQVEAVAWASGMKDLLAGMLALAAIRIHLTRAGLNWKHTAAATLLAALAMLAKPSAVVVGPICIVCDVLLLGRRMKVAAMRALPMLLIAIPIVLIARHVQETDSVPPVAWWQRPVIAGDALAFYLGKLLLPLHLAIDYGQRPAVVLAGKNLTLVLAVVPLLVTLIVWRFRDRAIVPAAAGLFALALLPVLGFTPFQFQLFSTVTDHYLYLAMLAPALLAAWIVTLQPGRMTYAIAAVLIALLGGKSFVQARTWHDDQTLFAQTLAVNPHSFLAHNNLGTLYQGEAIQAERSGNAARAAEMRRRAIDQFKHAMDDNPDFAPPYAHRAALARQEGDHEHAAEMMLEYLRLILALPPRARGDSLTPLRTLSEDLMASGHYAAAAKFLEQYVRARPDDTAAVQRLIEARAHLHVPPPPAPATAPTPTLSPATLP